MLKNAYNLRLVLFMKFGKIMSEKIKNILY